MTRPRNLKKGHFNDIDVSRGLRIGITEFLNDAMDASYA